MKKLFLTALLGCMLLSAQAQDQHITLDDVATRGFTGVQSINNGQFFYTFYFGELTNSKKGMAAFVLHIFDENLKQIVKREIEVTKRSELEGVAFSGKYFLLIFEDQPRQVRTLVLLDKDGVMLKTKDDEVEKLAWSADNNPDIHVLNEDEFVVIKPEKQKKYGFSIQRIDKDLNVKWTRSCFPEKGKWKLIDSKLKNNTLYVLRGDIPNGMSHETVHKVQAIDVATGNDQYMTELVSDLDGGYPNFINVQDDGTVVTGGMYFKNGVYDEKNSDGFFFASLGKDGKINVFNKTTWKSVKEQIRGEGSSDLIGGKTKVLIEDLVRLKDGSYVVIGETFRKSSASMTGDGLTRMAIGSKGGMFGGGSSSTSSSDKGMTIMDFIFLYFDANGNMTKLQMVEKPTLEAIVSGWLADDGALQIAQTMYKCHFFCYRSTIEHNGKQYVVFKNEDGYKMRAYFLPLGATSVDSIGNIDLDKWVPKGLNAFGSLSKATGGRQHQFDEHSKFYELYKNTIPAKPGMMMSYEYNGAKSTLNIWLEPIPEYKPEK